MTGEYKVHAIVRYDDGTPADDVEIVAADADLGIDDALGIARTRTDGRVVFEFDESAVGELETGPPDVALHVFRDGTRLKTATVPAHTHPTMPEGVDMDGMSADSMPDIDTTIAPETITVEDPTDDGETGMEPVAHRHHGMTEHRGMMNVPRDPAHPGQGRFGRLFPHIEPLELEEAFLQDLGLPHGVLDEGRIALEEGDAPAGFVFLGQFIDHDITLDPLSSLSRRNDPDALRNFRTPRLDLDSVYGSGPEPDPYLYQTPEDGNPYKFLIGENDEGNSKDLQRNEQGVAVIGDPRNDENLVISQLQLAIQKFHNRVVDWVEAREDVENVFERAQQLVRWHYQWVVLYDYLPTVCDEAVVEAVRDEGDRRFFTVGPTDEAYMPLEFAGAAYRFGHSQARFRYDVNDDFAGKLFGEDDDESLNEGFEPVPERKAVDWRHFFDVEGADTDPQVLRGIDTKLARDLLELPFVESETPWRQSLASRNLVRGQQLGLPSGQAVARAMEDDDDPPEIRVSELDNEEIGFDEALAAHGQPADAEAPLWYYVLAEANELNDGDFLGPVGSRIVAETLVGLIDSDTSSFRVIEPEWEPVFEGDDAAAGGFGMADLLDFTFQYTSQ